METIHDQGSAANDSTPNSTILKLEDLPIEILRDIFWKSRELSLILTCRFFHSILPDFTSTARSLSLLAFCEYSPATGNVDLDLFRDATSIYLLDNISLPFESDLKLPLSKSARKELCEDVILSDWWDIYRFRRMNVYLYKFNLSHMIRLMEDDKISAHPKFIGNVVDTALKQYGYLESLPDDELVKLNGDCAAKLSRWSIAMQDCFGWLNYETSSQNCNQHRYGLAARFRPYKTEFHEHRPDPGYYELHNPTGWTLTLLRFSRTHIILQCKAAKEELEPTERRWNIMSPAFLPPALLQGPFTAKQRGILQTLANFLCGSVAPLVLQPCWEDFVPAIFQAIQLNDCAVLRCLLKLRRLGDRVPRFDSSSTGYGGLLLYKAAIQQGHVEALEVVKWYDTICDDLTAKAKDLWEPLEEVRSRLDLDRYEAIAGVIKARQRWEDKKNFYMMQRQAPGSRVYGT